MSRIVCRLFYLAPISCYTPFGQLLYGSTNDPYLYTGLEHDSESNLEAAAARQYSSTTGRWTSPDPYDGSMDLSNPQSLNRCSYVNNMPLTGTDPTGLFTCGTCGGGDGGGASGEGFDQLIGVFFQFLFGGPPAPTYHGDPNEPRPNYTPWDEHGSYKPVPYTSAAQILGLGGQGCEFGACGDSFVNGGVHNCVDLFGSPCTHQVWQIDWQLVLKVATLAGCVTNEGMQEITNEEDGKAPTYFSFVNSAAAAAMKGKIPGFWGAAAIGVAAVSDISVVMKSYQTCTRAPHK